MLAVGVGSAGRYPKAHRFAFATTTVSPTFRDVMSKLKLKKASKAMRRVGRGAVDVAGGIAKIAEAIVIVAGLVEKVQARRRSGSSGEGSRSHDPNADG